MQYISLATAQKQKSQSEKLLNDIKTWKRDAKKYGQSALYDLLSDTLDYIKRQEKALDGKPVASVGFTLSPADKAFADFIKARDGYQCQKCGKQYAKGDKGLQCSHHFSRRYYNIRFDPDNALALCHHCHNYWYQKDIPESARWLEEKLGKDKIDRLIALKNQPQTKPTASEELAIAERFKQLMEVV